MTNSEMLWLIVGFLGQALFAGRFIIQWLMSEKKRRSVIPTSFWYLSLGGGIILLGYAIHKQDPVFILGQFMGLFIYLRNLYLIQAAKDTVPSESGEIQPPPSRFTHKIRENPEITWLVVGFLGMVISAILFYLNPHWDIQVATKFYDESVGFPRDVPLIEFFRLLVNMTTYTVIGVIVVGWIGYLLKDRWPLWRFNHRTAAFLALSLALGPALLVNGVCKNGFHRARPYQVTEFEGDKMFTPAFVITDQCPKNCSFVSGDPSIMFFLLAFVLLFPHRRLMGFLLTLVIGAIIGYGRLCYGAHFISDVLFSGFMTYLTVLLVYVLFGKPTYFEESTFEESRSLSYGRR